MYEYIVNATNNLFNFFAILRVTEDKGILGIESKSGFNWKKRA